MHASVCPRVSDCGRAGSSSGSSSGSSGDAPVCAIRSPTSQAPQSCNRPPTHAPAGILLLVRCPRAMRAVVALCSRVTNARMNALPSMDTVAVVSTATASICSCNTRESSSDETLRPLVVVVRVVASVVVIVVDVVVVVVVAVFVGSVPGASVVAPKMVASAAAAVVSRSSIRDANRRQVSHHGWPAAWLHEHQSETARRAQVERRKERTTTIDQAR